MVPYALALGATHFDVALLTSARNLLLALVQLASGPALERLGSRRTLVLWTVGLQALLWLPLAFAQPLFGSLAVPGLLLCYTLGTASAALGQPAWGSWLADYVAAHARGRYFGRRTRLAGIANSAAAATAGGVLQLAQTRPMLGFGVICGLAGLTRGLAWRALRSLRDRDWKEEPHLRFSFAQFLRRAPRSNFARFALCIGANAFAANVASPYFPVYLLEELHYPYATYTLVMLASSLTGIFCGSMWGRLGDRRGNRAVLRWTFFAVTPFPLLWLLCAHPLWMIAVNAAGAFMWAGLNLAAANYIYDAVTPGRRHTCIAYTNVLNGLGISMGALAGGALARAAGTGEAPFTAIFWLSTALRLVSALAFLCCVREVRPAAPAR